jgi:hypothetical protein
MECVACRRVHLKVRCGGSPLAKPTARGPQVHCACASECLPSARGLGLGSNDTYRSVNHNPMQSRIPRRCRWRARSRCRRSNRRDAWPSNRAELGPIIIWFARSGLPAKGAPLRRGFLFQPSPRPTVIRPYEDDAGIFQRALNRLDGAGLQHGPALEVRHRVRRHSGHVREFSRAPPEDRPREETLSQSEPEASSGLSHDRLCPAAPATARSSPPSARTGRAPLARHDALQAGVGPRDMKIS